MFVRKNKYMFHWFKKDPIKDLEKKYLQMLEEARDIQRSGNLRAYATKLDEAEKLQEQIDQLKRSAKKD